MAYMDQSKKHQIAAAMKKVCIDTHTKFSLSVANHSVLCVTIKSSDLDLLGNMKNKAFKEAALHEGERAYQFATAMDWTSPMQVNHYHLKSQFTGECLTFMEKLLRAINCLNHDNSDIQTDYFDVGYYVSITLCAKK